MLSINDTISSNGSTTIQYDYYPLSQDRVSPTWNDPDDPETAQWMLTIGCMMRDIMHSFLVVGDFKVMQELDEVSQVLFYGFFKKDCGGEGVDENLDNLSPSSQEIMESKLETVDATTGAPLVSMLDINAVRDLVDDGVLSPRMDKMQKNDVWGQGEQTVETYDVSDINVEMCQLNLDKVDVLSATYLYSYIRGSEATVILDMLRGNAVKAKDTVEGLLVLIDKFCSTDLSVVKVIFLPRLFALLSCCSVSEDKRFANALLIKAEMWLAKAKEERTSDSIRAFYSAAKPSLPGIRHLHVSDSGEWMLMVVVALRLCGEGKWISAIEEFESAINEMKEINDKSLMYQIRLLLCWAFFMIGDITGFHVSTSDTMSNSLENNLIILMI